MYVLGCTVEGRFYGIMPTLDDKIRLTVLPYPVIEKWKHPKNDRFFQKVNAALMQHGYGLVMLICNNI